MSARDALTSRDLRSALTLIEGAATDDPGPLLPWTFLEGIAALIPAEEVSICELDVVRRVRQRQQGVLDLSEHDFCAPGDAEGGIHELYWRHYSAFWKPASSTPLGVRRWSDYYSPRELRRQPLYAEFFGPAGVKHFMMVSMPAPSGEARSLLFFRDSGRDFTEREKLLLQILRPHLYEVYCEADRRRVGQPELTTREWEVLELVARGDSNTEIARRLCISPATVRKHLEHIFDRTGVRTRGAAVARMMPELGSVSLRVRARRH